VAAFLARHGVAETAPLLERYFGRVAPIDRIDAAEGLAWLGDDRGRGCEAQHQESTTECHHGWSRK
jgi:hypothetical protein